jgi:hypothetical protein
VVHRLARIPSENFPERQSDTNPFLLPSALKARALATGRHEPSLEGEDQSRRG